MSNDVKKVRENKKQERRHKKIRSTVITLSILIILASVGVVNAGTQSYDVLYKGEHLGYVHSPEIFESAIKDVENTYKNIYLNDAIIIGDDFELVPGRLDESVDCDTWVTLLHNSNIELYINGYSILVDDQEIGIVESHDTARNIIKMYQNEYPLGEKISYEEKTVPYIEIKSLERIITEIRELEK
jgi:hypothetical protein